MSRSYKKAIFKDGGRAKKYQKRFAAKAVRNCPDLDNGGAYKKVYNLYNIDDYVYDGRFKPETHFWPYSGVQPSWQTLQPGAP